MNLNKLKTWWPLILPVIIIIWRLSIFYTEVTALKARADNLTTRISSLESQNAKLENVPDDLKWVKQNLILLLIHSGIKPVN